ncbi:rho gtpase activating protein 22, partial [Moniliophthora roreri]
SSIKASMCLSTGYGPHIDNCVNGPSFSLVNVEWDHYSCQALVTRDLARDFKPSKVASNIYTKFILLYLELPGY